MAAGEVWAMSSLEASIPIPWPVLWPSNVNNMDYHWMVTFKDTLTGLSVEEPVTKVPTETHLRLAVMAARNRLARLAEMKGNCAPWA